MKTLRERSKWYQSSTGNVSGGRKKMIEYRRWDGFLRVVLGLAICVWPVVSWAQASSSGGPEKMIIDTDIGDDVDDAFALALAVKSPELRILGVTTTFGDTEGRAKIV